MGRGVSKDYKVSAKWRRLAAEQGSSFAQSDLGYMYQHGHGVKKDYGEAIKWYRKAAENGRAVSQRNLGVLYYHGYGVPRDWVQAAMWFYVAAFIDETGAFKELGAHVTDDTLKQVSVHDRYSRRITKLLTTAQIAQAQKLAREWWAAYQKRKAK